MSFHTPISVQGVLSMTLLPHSHSKQVLLRSRFKGLSRRLCRLVQNELTRADPNLPLRQARLDAARGTARLPPQLISRGRAWGILLAMSSNAL